MEVSFGDFFSSSISNFYFFFLTYSYRHFLLHLGFRHFFLSLSPEIARRLLKTMSSFGFSSAAFAAAGSSKLPSAAAAEASAAFVGGSLGGSANNNWSLPGAISNSPFWNSQARLDPGVSSGFGGPAQTPSSLNSSTGGGNIFEQSFTSRSFGANLGGFSGASLDSMWTSPFGNRAQTESFYNSSFGGSSLGSSFFGSSYGSPSFGSFPSWTQESVGAGGGVSAKSNSFFKAENPIPTQTGSTFCLSNAVLPSLGFGSSAPIATANVFGRKAAGDMKDYHVNSVTSFNNSFSDYANSLESNLQAIWKEAEEELLCEARLRNLSLCSDLSFSTTTNNSKDNVIPNSSFDNVVKSVLAIAETKTQDEVEEVLKKKEVAKEVNVKPRSFFENVNSISKRFSGNNKEKNNTKQSFNRAVLGRNPLNPNSFASAFVSIPSIAKGGGGNVGNGAQKNQQRSSFPDSKIPVAGAKVGGNRGNGRGGNRNAWSNSPFSTQNQNRSNSHNNKKSTQKRLAAPPVSSKMECSFCKNIAGPDGETGYKTHWLKDRQNVITCPKLRAYTCPLCLYPGGDKSHTKR